MGPDPVLISFIYMDEHDMDEPDSAKNEETFAELFKFLNDRSLSLEIPIPGFRD